MRHRLVAGALILLVSVSGCAARSAARTGTEAPTTAPATSVGQTIDPSTADATLTDLNGLLDGVDSALTEADAAAADED